MSSYIFGAPFTRRYFPEQDGQTVNLPDVAPTIYIFGETQPSLTDASAGTGAVQTITTWEKNENSPYDFAYTVDTINDPDPSSPVWCRTYWEAIKVKTLESGTPIVLVRSFELERPGLGDSFPRVTSLDLISVYPTITSYLSEDQLTDHIQLALTEIKLELEAKGLDWSSLKKRDRLFLAVAYKALAASVFSQIRDPNDKHALRWREWKEQSAKCLNLANSLPQDKNRDGSSETIEAASSNQIVVAG